MQKFQRDKFIEIVSKNLEKNKNIFFLSADFGAPALDQLREKFKSNFIHLGISEQNMVDVSIGLALEGKTVINYAMAPFVSLRCLEQLKTASLMHLPIITLVPGIGLVCRWWTCTLCNRRCGMPKFYDRFKCLYCF